MNRWIVMTASKSMPSRVKAPYRKVAIVRLTEDYAKRGLVPKFIGLKAIGVEEIIDCGYHNVGQMIRSAYKRALDDANEHCARLNAKEEEQADVGAAA